MFLLGLFQGVGEWEEVEKVCIFWGDCCWEVQMRKDGKTVKRRNSS